MAYPQNFKSENFTSAYCEDLYKTRAIRCLAFLVVGLALAALSIGLFGCGSSEETGDAQQDYSEGSDSSSDTTDSEDEQDTEAGVDYTDYIEEILQNPELPSGCEPTSLVIVLNAMGFSIDPVTFVDTYVEMDSSWTDATMFLGSPYTGGGAFPPAVVNMANAFLEDYGSQATATDISGATFEEIIELTQEGTPVLVWTTMYMQETPAYSGQVIGEYSWYRNEHCVVVYGVSEEGDVLVSDPLDGLVERDYDTFKEIYEACGQMAVIIS